jgi:hypothetical protein
MSDFWNQRARDEEIARQLEREKEEQRRREEEAQKVAERREYERPRHQATGS